MNAAHNLFLLMFNLSQLHNFKKIIEIFIGGVSDIFKNVEFQYFETEAKNKDLAFEIKTRNSYFGFVEFKNWENLSEENKILINNSIQMLAVILERLKFDETLEKAKNKAEEIANERFNELQTKIIELKKAKNDSLNLIDDLTNEIEKRTKFENELKESEEKFRNFFENSTVGLSITKIDGSIRSNKAFCNILGYSENEIKNIKWMDITHPEDIDISNMNIQSLLSGENLNVRFEKRYLHKNNNIIWVDISTYLQKDKNEEPQFYITSIVDITERKKTEDAIAESELLLRQSQIAAGIGSYILEFNEGIWKSSEVLDEIFGINKDYKRSIEGWSLLIHPEMRQTMNDYFAYDVFKLHGIFDKKYKIIRVNDKIERWVHGIGRLEFDESGNLVRMVGTIQDITIQKRAEETLKQSEERFKSIVEGAPDPIFIQTNMKFSYLNPAACKLFGIKSPSELIGSQVMERFHPGSREKLLKRIQQLNENKSVKELSEQRFIKIDGSEVWVETAGEPIIFEGEHGALVFVRDISQRKQAEQILAKSEKRFSLLAKSAPIGIIIDDKNENIIYINEHFTKILGYTIEDIPNINVWWKLAYPDNAQREQIRKHWEEEIKKAKNNESEINPVEYPVTCKNGKVAQIEFRIATTSDFNFIIFTDVTERKKSEEELKKLKDNLEIQVSLKTKELKQRIDELERFHDATIDRELRMKELKIEIERLKNEHK